MQIHITTADNRGKRKGESVREILFRGFYEDENGKEKAFYGGEWHVGEWVYGTPQTNARGQTFICFEMFNGWNIEEPSTIGQFTGLLDKNGKKIFEGDLVRNGYSSNFGEFWDIGNVVYVPTDGCFEISNLCERYLKRLTQTQIIKRSIEVVGNIHDKE